MNGINRIKRNLNEKQINLMNIVNKILTKNR